jgi:plastocyanin
MQPRKRHLPIVGLIGLVVVAAAGGGIFYYQFVLSHTTLTYTPVHRLVMMNAIVQEQGGFHIDNTAYLNQTTPPGFDPVKGYNLTGVNYQKYMGASDNKTINIHTGDTIIFYIFGRNASGSDPNLHLSQGHGFSILGPTTYTVAPGGILGATTCTSTASCIEFGMWYTVTITFDAAGIYTYQCSINCSPQHGNMNGKIVVT